MNKNDVLFLTGLMAAGAITLIVVPQVVSTALHYGLFCANSLAAAW